MLAGLSFPSGSQFADHAVAAKAAEDIAAAAHSTGSRPATGSCPAGRSPIIEAAGGEPSATAGDGRDGLEAQSERSMGLSSEVRSQWEVTEKPVKPGPELPKAATTNGAAVSRLTSNTAVAWQVIHQCAVGGNVANNCSYLPESAGH